MKNAFVLILLAAGGLALGIVVNSFFATTPSTPTATALKNGTSLAGQEKPMMPFQLTDHNGKSFGNAELQGQWSFLFFGYTQCPDICPTTLQDISQTLQALKKEVDAGEVRGLFISVDPERDTTELLKTYTEYFHPAILGLTGNHETLQPLTRSLGILYRRAENKAKPEQYLVDHSAAVLVINPEGKMTAVLSPPHDANTMAADLRTLMSH